MVFKLQVILKESGVGVELWWESLGQKRKDVLKTSCLIHLNLTAMKSVSGLKTPILQTMFCLLDVGFPNCLPESFLLSRFFRVFMDFYHLREFKRKCIPAMEHCETTIGTQ